MVLIVYRSCLVHYKSLISVGTPHLENSNSLFFSRNKDESFASVSLEILHEQESQIFVSLMNKLPFEPFDKETHTPSPLVIIKSCD